MRISELGRTAGVDVETIRYYEKAGLLQPPARSANGYREYGEAQAQRLAFIRQCRALDMTIKEIQSLLDIAGQPAAECSDVDRLVDEHLRRVRERIKSLRSLEQQLVVLRGRCGAPRTAADCGILKELSAPRRKTS